MKKLSCAVLALSMALGLFAPAQAIQQPAANEPIPDADPWWKHAVFYEIYPRSFGDADNNGMGDLKGITAKLDYLKDLGVDAIWITPCYPSPQVDFGYDISDYTTIAPEYGTLDDFDKLVAEAKKHNIKIVMDLVMNHTSDKHKWFVESRSSKTNPKRNWYIWREGKPGPTPPNNWQSLFGHSAWKKDPETEQYYYHFFYPEQPDLNWRNPEVKQAMYDVTRFWLDRGVAGFRLDAIGTLFEDPNLTDNPEDHKKKNKFGDPEMQNINNDRLPEVNGVMKELRAVLDTYPDSRVLVGETSTEDIQHLSAMYGKNLDEIQLPMNFFFAYINKLSPDEFRKQILAWDNNPAKGWPVYLFSNHDSVRHYDRYGDGKHNDEIAKITATLLLTLRGTPILYYGEELGMQNNDPKRVQDVQDPIGKLGWPKEKGRDGERTPMQWSAAKNAGFSTSKPWLPVASNYTTHNVEAESKDPDSILNFYKSLIRIRKTNEALQRGYYAPLNEDDKEVLSYLRQGANGAVLVAMNMSNTAKHVKFDLSPHGIKSSVTKTLLRTGQGKETEQLADIELAPYAVYVGEVSRL